MKKLMILVALAAVMGGCVKDYNLDTTEFERIIVGEWDFYFGKMGEIEQYNHVGQYKYRFDGKYTYVNGLTSKKKYKITSNDENIYLSFEGDEKYTVTEYHEKWFHIERKVDERNKIGQTYVR